MCGGGGSPKITGINVSEGGKGEAVVDLRTTHRTAGFPVGLLCSPESAFLNQPLASCSFLTVSGPYNQIRLQLNHLHTGKFERREGAKGKEKEVLCFQLQGRSRLESTRQPETRSCLKGRSPQPLGKTVRQLLQNLNAEWPHDSAIPLLDVCLKALKAASPRDIRPPAFTAGLFTIGEGRTDG